MELEKRNSQLHFGTDPDEILDPEIFLKDPLTL